MNREQWDSLSDKGQWDIKVALRGPDSYFGETLKWFTTAVIRGQMKEVFHVGGSVNSDLKLVILPRSSHYSEEPSTESQHGKFSWNSSHFIEHVRQAADWMGIPVLKIPRELWNQTMQYTSHTKAAVEILAYLDSKKKKSGEEVEEEPPVIYGFSRPRQEAQIEELRRHYMQHIGGKYNAKSSIQ